MPTIKHTPGPWVIEDSYVLQAATNKSIAEVFAVDTTLDTDAGHANARLIAAAPELLVALKDILASFDGVVEGKCRICGEPRKADDLVIFPCDYNPLCASNTWRKVIAKAEG